MTDHPHLPGAPDLPPAPAEPAPAEPAWSWPPEPEPEPAADEGVPAWVDPAAFTDDAEEPEYDAWAQAQDLEPPDQNPWESAQEANPPTELIEDAGEPVVEAATEPVADAEPEADAEPLADAEPVAEEPVAVEPVLELPPAADAEAPVAEDTESTEHPAPAVPDVPGAGTSRALVVVLAAVLAVLVGLVAFLAVAEERTRGGGAKEQARRDAVASAREAARVLFSYDYRHLAKDFNAGKQLSTGEFLAEYTRTTGKLIDDVATRIKAVVVADVSDAAVVTVDQDRAVVLVFVDQQSTSLLQASRLTQSRLELHLVKRGKGWLVEKIHVF